MQNISKTSTAYQKVVKLLGSPVHNGQREGYRICGKYSWVHNHGQTAVVNLKSQSDGTEIRFMEIKKYFAQIYHGLYNTKAPYVGRKTF